MQGKYDVENRCLGLYVKTQAFNNQVKNWLYDLEGGC